MKKVLCFYGGWDGHTPAEATEKIAASLTEKGYSVDRYGSQECLSDREKLCTYDLIIPCWTMGEIAREYEENILYAVSHGTGLAGWHGGMCDAFRNSTDWQFMTGAQWVAHPGGDGVTYTVNIVAGGPLTDGIEDFSVTSEQYYIHYDPAVDVFATTEFNLDGKKVAMPVVFTKMWGQGRVYYCSLCHTADELDRFPSMKELIIRGCEWAAR